MKSLFGFILAIVLSLPSYALSEIASSGVLGSGVVAAPPSITYFLEDTLTDSDVAIASHTPTTGGTWVPEAGETLLVTATGVTSTGTTNAAIAYNDATHTTADM